MGHGARRALAARLAREHGLTLVTDWPMPLLGVDCYVMTIAPGQESADRTPQKVAEALSRDARVVWAQAMNLYRTRGPTNGSTGAALGHNDPLYPLQPAAHVWRLAELHELATGRGVRLAVVDSGVDQAHPDLAGQVSIAENFVEGRPYAVERHGTAVAGIIVARANNGIGIAGIAPQATLMALRACWQESPDNTLCTSLSLAKALHFAIAQRAAVVNVSLSGPKDRLLGQLIDAALSRGITVIAAADSASPDGGFPASHAGVWAVTDNASDARGQVQHAPGRDIPTTVPGGGWQVVGGASYAAAHVAGLAALLHELGGILPIQHIFVLLPSGDIDTCATLMRLTGPRVCSCAGEPSRSAAASTIQRLRKP
jgi:subtilisin family serine protease